MAPPTRTPPRAWIDAGLRALAEGGPGAVRVESLAKELGATRGSFYWHFTDRRALLDAMLDVWEQMSTDEVIDLVETEGGDARAKVLRAGALTFSEVLLPIDLAVRDWARREPAVLERLRRVDNRRMDYARSLFRAFCADRTRSRRAACSPSRSSSAVTSWPPITACAPAPRWLNWQRTGCSPDVPDTGIVAEEREPGKRCQ